MVASGDGAAWGWVSVILACRRVCQGLRARKHGTPEKMEFIIWGRISRTVLLSNTNIVSVGRQGSYEGV